MLLLRTFLRRVRLDLVPCEYQLPSISEVTDNLRPVCTRRIKARRYIHPSQPRSSISTEEPFGMRADESLAAKS